MNTQVSNTEKRLASNVTYTGEMDPEVLDLCNALNALPGISTTESCCGHGKEKFSIFFQTYGRSQKEGLFFLARCIDRRYWKYGHLWDATLVVGDTYPPTRTTSRPTGLLLSFL